MKQAKEKHLKGWPIQEHPYTKTDDAPIYKFDIASQSFHGHAHTAPASNINKTYRHLTLPPKQQRKPYHQLKQKAENRDFILEYKLAANAIESGRMLYEHGDENFFLPMVQPPKRVIREQIPLREYI